MDNGQMPPVQVGEPGQLGQGASGMPMIQQVQVMPEAKKDIAGLIKTIVIILVSLVAVVFIGLFIWMYMQYDEARTDVDGQIAIAVAAKKDELDAEYEAEFLEREKYPYKTFAGPVDYGELTFEYPKTWSVYIAKDAANGGNFEAYLNPVQVDPISNSSINALRVEILDSSFESVVAQYQKFLQSRDSPLSVETISVGGTTGNLYSGVLPNSSLSGYILIFKIRDKTAVLRTDSELFKGDFDKLIETVKFNA